MTRNLTSRTKLPGILFASAFAFTMAYAGPAAAEEDRPGEGVSVQPAVATWTSAVPVSWVFVELLEELGYDVQTPVSLSNPVAYLAISEGGRPDPGIAVQPGRLSCNFRG